MFLHCSDFLKIQKEQRQLFELFLCAICIRKKNTKKQDKCYRMCDVSFKRDKKLKPCVVHSSKDDKGCVPK